PGRGPRSPGEPTGRPDLPAQDERGQRALGPALVEPSRRVVHVPASAGPGRHQLARRIGDPLRRYPAEGLGRQPALGGGAGAVGADVGVADLLAARAFGPGLPQPTPSRQTSGPGLAPVTYRANSRSVNRHPSAFRLADAEEKG